jgi:4-hydroxy-3-methylbut-2-enyl diphosphate reductase
MSRALVLTPLRLEAFAIRSARTGVSVLRTGMGPERSRTAARAADLPADAVAVAGLAGALDASVRPGDLVVASEVRGPEGSVACPGAEALALLLRRRGLRARVGPLLSSPRLVRGRERAQLARGGALAVDMESAWLVAAAAGRPFAVVRAVVDRPGGELLGPRTPLAGIRALRALRRAAPALEEWTRSVRPRRVLLAGPRASCAGVDRAIQTVERALATQGPPLYVRRQIVHNAHVVADLERRGVVFVHEVDQVPHGATVVFSAHGVPPAARELAAERDLRVIDATCPLVAKVHAEARRFAAAGQTVVLVGHEGHDEVEGTMGEAPDRMRLVQALGDVDRLQVEDPERVSYLLQTTLAVDEANVVVDALQRRFPRLAGPPSDDICYATQNRQDAVRAIAADCDVMLVIGSANSSNANRLKEVAERSGCPARLIDDESELDPGWLRRAGTVGLTAGASAPETLVWRVVNALRGLGPLEVEDRTITSESERFRLPTEVRDAAAPPRR